MWRPASCRCPVPRTWRSSSTRCQQDLQHGRLARGHGGGQRRGDRGADHDQDQHRFGHFPAAAGRGQPWRSTATSRGWPSATPIYQRRRDIILGWLPKLGMTAQPPRAPCMCGPRCPAGVDCEAYALRDARKGGRVADARHRLWRVWRGLHAPVGLCPRGAPHRGRRKAIKRLASDS